MIIGTFCITKERKYKHAKRKREERQLTSECPLTKKHPKALKCLEQTQLISIFKKWPANWNWLENTKISQYYHNNSPNLPKMCYKGAWSPQATNIWSWATGKEKHSPVQAPRFWLVRKPETKPANILKRNWTKQKETSSCSHKKMYTWLISLL